MIKRQSPAASNLPRLRVGFVLTRRFTICAFANFVDVLRLAADEGDRSRPILCSWKVLSASMTPVVSSSGISVQPEEPLGDPRRFDYIVVIGGLMEELERLSPEYTAFLQRAAAYKIPLVGVCTGAFVLHRAGVMQGHRCCVSWFHHNDFLEQFEDITPVSDQIFVVDRGRLTCSGGTSSAHLAAFLVDRHIGHAAAQKSLAIMMIDEAMAAERPQPGVPLELTTDDPVVRRALLLLHQALEAPPNTAALAWRLKVSPRTLERRFASALGMTPFEAGKRIRLAHAERLLRGTDRSITRIAHETGFSDVSHFIRVFKAVYDTTPEVWRAREVTDPGSEAAGRF
ncbi:AraC family transcriptional regulator [Maritimibacter sp. 55A14]|uniref:GlxA family transcriptional regulator n=1 Tax=Maritimibacter sp. 55A14 TaxID=2174844 RepID=UPI000D605065|nr:GlxA family transcriptional regulator [Maritimibacter sp. 55A14]PWE30612.1 AraC family transcriptional regulator [Maritimibacter sp. 55A14]